jgi:uncharacterized membrane protein
MSTRNLFAWILMGLVIIITFMALLGVWDVIDWSFLRQYMGKTIQSLIIIVISGVVIYIISAIFNMNANKANQQNNSGNQIP